MYFGWDTNFVSFHLLINIGKSNIQELLILTISTRLKLTTDTIGRTFSQIVVSNQANST